MAALPVVIIGAGPVGLAALAHLLERGETPLLFERGTAIAANVRDWAHVRLFSPWEFTVDAAMVRLLQAAGWQMPPSEALPTGSELVERYLQPFAELPSVAPHIHLGAQVMAISRQHTDKMKDAQRQDAPFVLHIAYADGRESIIEARAVIDASGTWHNPNPLGADGLPALGEARLSERIAYGIPDVLGAQVARYADQRVLVVGSGHSAINALLDLVTLSEAHPQTRILWAMRSTALQRVYGGGEDDGLPARGQLGQRIRRAVESGLVRLVAPFRLERIERAADGSLAVTGQGAQGAETLNVDQIIGATGARPMLDFLREVRLDLDPALESARTLAPLIDPNIHSCGTVRPHGEAELRQPEAQFYIVGMKSYGRAPTFLLATGYEQVRSIVAGLVGDWAAAREVHLNLPETGVCSTDLVDGGSCCAPTPAATISLGNIGIGDILTLPPR